MKARLQSLGVGALVLGGGAGIVAAAAHRAGHRPSHVVDCAPCVTRADCRAGGVCAQFGGDAYCAVDCAGGQACDAQHACARVATVDGEPASVCVPLTNPCGVSGGNVGLSSTSPDAGAGVCGVLAGPSVGAACHACRDRPCQANGCWGGFWCNTHTRRCQPPPAPGTCGAPVDLFPGGSTSSSSAGGGGDGGSPIGADGGVVDDLDFAIVGDTRPPGIDDTTGYPTAVITRIWQDVEAHRPRPTFAVTTGDYVFASTTGGQAAPQLAIYTRARAAYTNVVFATMGNHECTGATASNCGEGTADGITDNYTQFMRALITPLGFTEPYYVIRVRAKHDAWTAKLVFVAANAWTQVQASWLERTLDEPTTYTFVMRHEPTAATTAPGVTPSETILRRHPVTMRVVGHTHTFRYEPEPEPEIVVGNGGAPLSSSADYGYVIARRRADGAIVFTEYDYATNAANESFAVDSDGRPVR